HGFSMDGTCGGVAHWAGLRGRAENQRRLVEGGERTGSAQQGVAGKPARMVESMVFSRPAIDLEEPCCGLIGTGVGVIDRFAEANNDILPVGPRIGLEIC